VTYRVECECGFAVEGEEAEAVATAQRHASGVHHIELGPSLIEAVARVIGDSPRGEECGQRRP
jgi:hypothetical protein